MRPIADEARRQGLRVPYPYPYPDRSSEPASDGVPPPEPRAIRIEFWDVVLLGVGDRVLQRGKARSVVSRGTSVRMRACQSARASSSGRITMPGITPAGPSGLTA